MGAAQSGEDAEDVWPPDWEALPEEKRRLARASILNISSLSNEDFLAIAETDHVIRPGNWNFKEYHAAAMAAVQEDSKLNKIVYRLVPRKLEESEFWRIYFSEVLFVLDSVKTTGQYPPPVRARTLAAAREVPLPLRLMRARAPRNMFFSPHPPLCACAQPPPPPEPPKPDPKAALAEAKARKAKRPPPPPADDSSCRLM